MHVGNYAPPGRALATGMILMGCLDAGAAAPRRAPVRVLGHLAPAPHQPGPFKPLRGFDLKRSDPRPACEGHDPELWFPAKNAKAEDIATARRICLSCPLFTECRTQAAGEQYGIWAADTTAERKDRLAGLRPKPWRVAEPPPAPRPRAKRRKRRTYPRARVTSVPVLPPVAPVVPPPPPRQVETVQLPPFTCQAVLFDDVKCNRRTTHPSGLCSECRRERGSE